VRGWGGALATATGVAAAAGAAQLGVGYGTGVIFWPQGTGQVADESWVISLIWSTWIAATSTIAGAVIADRLQAGIPGGGPLASSPDDRLGRLLWRLALALAASIGALVTVALVAVPAREAGVAGVTVPQAQAVGYTALGVLVGLVIAVGALAARVVAVNLIATTGWLWGLAVIAVTEGLLSGRESSRVPLGFWDLGASGPWFRNILLPGAGIALGAALVVGLLTALPAARRGDHPAGVAVSGAAGPLVLAAAYLMAQPDLAGAAADSLSRHLVAPYLVLAGLAGSLLVAAVRSGPPMASGDTAAPAGAGVPAARGPTREPAGGRVG
jgi:hypothetical protein